jgi:hypothetical protein
MSYRLALERKKNRAQQNKKLQSVGIEPTLLRTSALSWRLNRSAKTAIARAKGPRHLPDVTSWPNGKASDSRPEDWGFDSL